jgi:DNA-binding response OmpR family regulator
MALRILLVEDSPTQAEFYGTSLKKAGFEVTLAENGRTALDLAIMEQPEVIILDVNLPGGMDGIQVCARLSRIPETTHIPVIILTQRDTPKDAMAGLKVGAVDYIAKDAFAVETLIESLKQFGIAATGR